MSSVIYQCISFQLLLTFAFVLLINDIVRLLWGSAPLTTPSSQLFEWTLQLFDRSYPAYNLLIILIAPLVGMGLWVFLNRTRWGRRVRATAQDRVMAGALGIDVPRLFTLVFMLGAWLAGVAGGLAGPPTHDWPWDGRHGHY